MPRLQTETPGQNAQNHRFHSGTNTRATSVFILTFSLICEKSMNLKSDPWNIQRTSGFLSLGAEQTTLKSAIVTPGHRSAPWGVHGPS